MLIDTEGADAYAAPLLRDLKENCMKKFTEDTKKHDPREVTNDLPMGDIKISAPTPTDRATEALKVVKELSQRPTSIAPVVRIPIPEEVKNFGFMTVVTNQFVSFEFGGRRIVFQAGQTYQVEKEIYMKLKSARVLAR